jgi:hypothetical protein
MWGIFSNALKLLFKGKLFRNPRAVLKKWLIGVASAVITLVGLAKAGLPLTLAIVLAALAGRALQPYLFKDLKYN